ncbi:MAG TPA: tetratricopeptide repeat protein, partial [Candidatus Polarisedimenticolaceae bacterium]|nr:tetratricopeptide repeat protein [Candidatus Polarisedimenticolaceae bacterium]
MIAFRKVAALAGAVAATVMVLSTIRATSEEAASLFDLAEQKRWEGDYPAARALHGRSLALRETTPATDPHDLVQSLRGLGNVHFKVAEYAEARSLADRALAIAESSFGPDDPELAEALVDVARVMRATGDYVSGRPLLDRALAIQETGHGPDFLQ